MNEILLQLVFHPLYTLQRLYILQFCIASFLLLLLTERLFTIHPDSNLVAHSSYFCNWEIPIFFLRQDFRNSKRQTMMMTMMIMLMMMLMMTMMMMTMMLRGKLGEKRSCSSCFRSADAANGADRTSQAHDDEEEPDDDTIFL